MAANYNRVILAGNLTRDPELSFTASNTAVCKFGMAINRKFKDQNGEMREDTCFVDITAFGRTGENINKYVSKGNPLMIEGRLNFSQWTSKEGAKRSKLDVVVETFSFIDSRSSSERGDSGSPAPARRSESPEASEAPEYVPDEGSDIPF
jgi:single-strand DNA-binding protein